MHTVVKVFTASALSTLLCYAGNLSYSHLSTPLKSENGWHNHYLSPGAISAMSTPGKVPNMCVLRAVVFLSISILLDAILYSQSCPQIA